MAAQTEVAERQQKFVRTEKKKLLDKLKENRTTHQKLWVASMKGWRTALAVELETYSKKCAALADKTRSSGDEVKDEDLEPDYPSFPRRPENHVEDYDEIIERLEFSMDDEINLTHGDFNRYVRDKWGWKGDFIATSNMYSPELAAEFMGKE